MPLHQTLLADKLRWSGSMQWDAPNALPRGVSMAYDLLQLDKVLTRRSVVISRFTNIDCNAWRHTKQAQHAKVNLQTH